MLGDKSQVDKHVYHLLAKCCNLNESKALEIAKLYHGVNEFATAKSYVEGYLQSRPDSVPAYLLLAKISEDLDDLSAALSAYKSVCSLSSCDKGTVLHACSLALESKELSEVQFWADMAESMFPSEKIAFMLKERVLISKNDDSELLKLLKSQLKKDESDSEVCVRFLNLLHKLRPATNVFTHLVQCINAGHHLGIASWFYECLSLVERMDQSSVNISLDTKSVCLIRAVCLMELVRVTAQTSCLSDMHNLLMKLELVANELSKSKSRILNALQSYAVIWLDFYGGVYAERRLMDSPTESADNFQHLLVYHFYQRVVSNQRPEIFHGSSSLSALVWSHLHRESFSLRTQATHLVHLFASLHDDLRPNEQGVNFRSLPWKQLISWVNGDPVIDSFKSHASNFNIKGDYVPDLFDEKESILDYLPSADCLNLIMWVCAQQLSLQNSSCEDFTLSIPRLDFLYKLVTKLFSKLEFCCTSPVFGSPAEFQSLSNVSVDQLCQIDIIGFMMSCFLHISIRSLSKANSKYSQPICSHLLVKPATAGTGLDFLCLPLCLIPTAQLSTSTQRAWWSALVKQVFESGSRTTIDDGNRSLLRCGLNQLRLVFHSTCCLNGESGMMSPPLLFRIAGVSLI
ncbi:unnamed protein product [Heterobilharzia americana]|nr:unnamed protein product [Heterobilharzia americana]